MRIYGSNMRPSGKKREYPFGFPRKPMPGKAKKRIEEVRKANLER